MPHWPARPARRARDTSLTPPSRAARHPPISTRLTRRANMANSTQMPMVTAALVRRVDCDMRHGQSASRSTGGYPPNGGMGSARGRTALGTHVNAGEWFCMACLVGRGVARSAGSMIANPSHW